MPNKESMKIADVIVMLEDGPYELRMKYYKELLSERGALINGFRFQLDTFCWRIWKPTDIGKDPQWKGEPLLKVVPESNVKPMRGRGRSKVYNIAAILDLQYWQYI